MKSFKKFWRLIQEGGNVFKDVSRINQENVVKTVENIKKDLSKYLKIPQDSIVPIGSTGKKSPGSSSGDIDLAVDFKPIIKNNKNVKDISDIFGLLDGKFPEVKLSKGLGLIHFAYPIANEDGKQKGQLVQVDLMFTDDLNFTTWTYYSPAEWESKYKGLYRNILLTALLKYANYKILEKAYNKEGEEVPSKVERYLFNMNKGLYKKIQSYIGKSGNIVKSAKTIFEKFITKDINEITKIAVGPNYKPQDILTYDSLIKIVLNPDFYNKENLDKILKDTAYGIHKQGYPLPPELEPYLK